MAQSKYIIIIVILVMVIIGLLWREDYAINKKEKENLITSGIIQEQTKQIEIVKHEKDSVRGLLLAKDSIIERQNKNKKIIYQAYEKKLNYINSLNAGEAVKLFAKQTSSN